jgi:hypothetical protein
MVSRNLRRLPARVAEALQEDLQRSAQELPEILAFEGHDNLPFLFLGDKPWKGCSDLRALRARALVGGPPRPWPLARARPPALGRGHDGRQWRSGSR